MRPPSIIWFERLFLAALLIGLVNSTLVYGQLGAAGGAQPLGAGVLIFSIGIGLVINVALWYFVARRASNAARWILVVLFVLGLASLLFSVAMGTFPPGAAGALGALGWVLQTASIVMLFRRDAAAWFRGSRVDDLDETFR
ncbi:hypothetical protein [Sphingomonas sp. Y38-1Y]|uniref:hypothetical protein n=1 Tax=Sphingomonas sp. Y38-1Y TaxID=3078265 RepID=UPI0028E9D10D|nr:hypothetical protein [Sphingomonas sp. Y38-1Y]